MKHTVIIEPYQKAYSDTVCPTSYNTGNKMRMLVDEYNYIEMDIIEVARLANNPAKFRPITFGKNKTEQVYIYHTKTEGDSQVPATAQDAMIQKTIEIFWKKHPLCVVNGKGHGNVTKENPLGDCKSPMFNVIDQVVKDVENINSFDTKLEIAQQIKGMTYDEKCDVMYYFGQSPVGLTDGQVLIKLADFSRGLCMSDIGAQKFKTAFVDGKGDREYYVAAQMAVEQGLITNQPKDGRDNYYHGSAMVGITIDDIVLHFKRDERLFREHILRQLKTDRSQEIAESDVMDKAAKGEKLSKYTPEHIETLRAKVVEYKKKKLIEPLINHKAMKPEKLEALIAEAERKEAESTATV